MSLTYLQGTPEGELGRRTKAQRKENRATKKQKRKESGGIKKKVAKIGLAPARASFLLAVKLNALKLADKLSKGHKKDKQRIISFWSKLGGDFSHLKTAIEQGSKKSLSGVTRDGELGVVAMSTAIMTATPIIIAVVKIFKDLGLTTPQEQTEEQVGIDNGKLLLGGSPEIEKDTANMPPNEDAGRTSPDGDPADEEGMSMGMKIGLGVAGAGALYFLTKKN
jgi:hypothetical protein